jgi:hypothetical protein
MSLKDSKREKREGREKKEEKEDKVVDETEKEKAGEGELCVHTL